jgi:hypothetical protein
VLDTIEAVRVGSARLTALHGLPPRAWHYGGDYKGTALAGELPPTAISPTIAHCLLDRFIVRESCCRGCRRCSGSETSRRSLASG